jgi:signal transduction histidine kinase
VGRALHRTEWPRTDWPRTDWRRLARDLASGLHDPFTFDLARNLHLWIGALWAITIPVFALAVDLAARGVPASAHEVARTVADRPIHVWFLAQPLLLGATFGAFGTLRARRLRQVAQLEVERDRNRRDAEFLALRQLAVAEAKDRLLSAVSHELKTPLASLRGYAELVRAGRLGPLTERQERALDVVLRASRRECDLIEDLIRFARLESHRYPIASVPLDLREVATAARNAFVPEARKRSVELELACPDQPQTVHADRDALAHAVESLVSNAVKFAPVGGRARLSVAREGGEATLTVEDDGPGVAPELRERVFEPFFQADMSDARQHGGAGLGLPLARAIVEAHGTALVLDRSPLGGARLRFGLPLSRAETLVGTCVPPAGASGAPGERPPVR